MGATAYSFMRVKRGGEETETKRSGASWKGGTLLRKTERSTFGSPREGQK